MRRCRILLQIVILLDTPCRLKVGTIPLFHLLDQPTRLIHHELHNTLEQKRLSSGLLPWQVILERSLIVGLENYLQFSIAELYDWINGSNTHLEVWDRCPPDLPVGWQYRSGADANDLESVVDILRLRRVQG